jgi:hypothetical protein|tara:strand:- start:126 stop:1592 length:1467 start_codon:yes stop_codon:yes gene_type:complete
MPYPSRPVNVNNNAAETPTGATDGRIKAAEWNELIRYYNEIWADKIAVPVFDAAHHTDVERRYGWGQTPAAYTPLVDNTQVILINHINQSVAQLNAGIVHQDDQAAPVTNSIKTQFADTYPMNLITATHYIGILDKIGSLTTNKYLSDFNDLNLAERVSTNTATWTDDLAVEHKFTFNTYSDARHFFNSGGELTFELSMAAGGSAGNMVWQELFDQFDSIRIGAETCKVVTADAGQFDVIGTSSIVPKGFYTGINYNGGVSQYTTVLDAGVFRYASGDTTHAYVYVHSEYNSRRIRIQLRADEDIANNQFNIYAKIILVEDADDTYDITQDITLTSGYSQPADATTRASDRTVNAVVYQFDERLAPTVTEHPNPLTGLLGWYETDVFASIENFTGVLNQTDFTIAQALGSGIQIGEITIDDVEQQPTVDYTLTGQVVTFITAPAAATAIKVTIVSGQLTNWTSADPGNDWNQTVDPNDNPTVYTDPTN